MANFFHDSVLSTSLLDISRCFNVNDIYSSFIPPMGHGAASGVGPMPDATFLKISGAKLEIFIFPLMILGLDIARVLKFSTAC